MDIGFQPFNECLCSVAGVFVTSSTCVFLKQPPTERGVGGRLDGGETLARRSSYLSREHYGLVGLVASGTKESSSHPSGLFCSEENAHERSDRNFADLSSSITGGFQTFSRDKILTNSEWEKKEFGRE